MKYIEAEKLKKIVEQAKQRALKGIEVDEDMYCDGRADAFEEVLLEIDSLQQEQPEFPTTDEEIEIFLATHPKVEVPNKYKTPDWLWKKLEQPEVELKKEIEDANDFEKVLADVFQSATTLVSSPSELVDAFKGKLLRSAFKCFAEKKALRQSLFAKQFSELPDEIKAVIERIAHDSCYTFCESFASLVAADKSYRKGKHDMKEQMMKDAVDAIVENWNPDPEPEITIPLNPEEFTRGDKVRVIIVKEDIK